MSYEVKVKQVHMHQFGGHWSGEKPALCLRGRKYTHCVVIDFPVRVLKKTIRDFDLARDTIYKGSSYPVKLMVSHLRDIGKRNGITVGAQKVLDAAISQVQLDEETTEEMNVEESNNAAPAVNTEEIKVDNEKVKKSKKSAAKKGAGKKQAKVAKPSKKAPPAKKAETKGDGLGREGTVTHLICEMLVKGESNEKILKAARAKFPQNKILDSYPGWYRNSLVKKGLLKASK